MLLRLFRGTGPGVILLIAITLGALWISAFIDPRMPGQAVYETSPMPLYGIVRHLIGTYPLTGVIFSFIIVTVMIFLLTYFNTSVFLMPEYSSESGAYFI